jgi:hypothetical protein
VYIIICAATDWEILILPLSSSHRIYNLSTASSTLHPILDPSLLNLLTPQPEKVVTETPSLSKSSLEPDSTIHPSSKMGIDYRGGVAILDLIVYFPCLFVAVYVAWKHGLGHSDGWLFAIFLSLLRIIGAAVELHIEAKSDPSKGLYTTVAICDSVGLSPLILLCVGLLHGSNESIKKRGGKSPVPNFIFWIFIGFCVAALALALVGGIKAADSGNFTKTQTLTKVGVVMFVGAWFALVLLTGLFYTLLGSIDIGRKRLVLAVAISLPFIMVRLIYAVLASFKGGNDFNYLTGNVTIYLVMATLEEFAVVITCLAVGVTLKGGNGPMGSL